VTKKHDELVEEIAGRIRHYKHFAEKRNPTASERIKASFDLAELFVTDVLSAVRDGLEIPGEDGRWIYGASPELQHWLVGMLAAGSTTFIALSGKEEE